MKKLVYLLFMSFLLLMSSCDKDDDTVVSGESLAQTTWKATYTFYNSFENSEYVYHYVLQFSTESSGTYADQDDAHASLKNFGYSIDKKIMNFRGFYSGDWTIMDVSEGRITLRHSDGGKDQQISRTEHYRPRDTDCCRAPACLHHMLSKVSKKFIHQRFLHGLNLLSQVRLHLCVDKVLVIL